MPKTVRMSHVDGPQGSFRRNRLVAFSPNGWVIVTRRGRVISEGISKGVHAKIEDLIKKGRRIEVISFSPDDETQYVIVTNLEVVRKNIPQACEAAILEFMQHSTPVTCVVLGKRPKKPEGDDAGIDGLDNFGDLGEQTVDKSDWIVIAQEAPDKSVFKCGGGTKEYVSNILTEKIANKWSIDCVNYYPHREDAFIVLAPTIEAKKPGYVCERVEEVESVLKYSHSALTWKQLVFHPTKQECWVAVSENDITRDMNCPKSLQQTLDNM